MAGLTDDPSGTSDPQLPFPQLAGRTDFQSQAVNAVAVVPLLSQGGDESFSLKSFRQLLNGFSRYAEKERESNQYAPQQSAPNDRLEYDESSMTEVDFDKSDAASVVADEVYDTSSSLEYTPTTLLVVPNSSLTRPGDWRYEKTPLRNFHWAHGCQRLLCFDGRPSHSREAHDRLLLQSTREWIDLVPSRRTAAVVGVLNIRDCQSKATDLSRAVAELAQWSERYSTPSYESTAHGRSFARDGVVQRLFVFDSFDESIQGVDLASTKLGSNLVAFPPSDDQNMMDLHLNVVVNDLTVAVFRHLEIKIRENDALSKEKGLSRPTPKAVSSDRPYASNLTLNNIASVVSSENFLSNVAAPRTNQSKSPFSNMAASAMSAIGHRGANRGPQLLTPMDPNIQESEHLSQKDLDALKKRELGRREKLSADLSLLAGSPLDAYERYSRAAELCKSTPDPLWYASALEGCAAAHIAMAEAGGYNVDLYLDTNFTLPEDFLAIAHNPSVAQQEKKTVAQRQALPSVVYALCEEALGILSRHPKLAYYHAALLLKLCSYGQEADEIHARCRWGYGLNCFGGDPGEPRRWDKTSAAQLTFGTLTGKSGEDLISSDSIQRLKRWTEFMHRAVTVSGLDHLTRADVALTCSRMALLGLQTTRWKHHDGSRWKLPRKAALFAAIAADSLSKCDFVPSTEMWLAATQLYSEESNAKRDGYGWATLRAMTLYALSKQDDTVCSEAAAELLLTLLSEMDPPGSAPEERLDEDDDDDDDDGKSVRSMSSRYSSYGLYRSERQMSTRAMFSGSNTQSAVITVAQAKWAEDPPLPPAPLPLGDDEEAISLSSVLPNIKPVSFVIAQKYTMAHLSTLRREIIVASDSGTTSVGARIFSRLWAEPPLNISSAAIVPSESHLLLERTKAAGFSGKATGAMATFFNPFENKKKQEAKKGAATLVAEGEEREVLIEFGNRLSVSLDVPSCELVFDKGHGNKIKAPALSFIVPAKATNFKVHFPFIVLAQPGAQQDKNNATDAGTSLYEVIGLRVTAIGRSVVIPIRVESSAKDDQIPENRWLPEAASTYELSKHNWPQQKEQKVKPHLEAVPAQPNLQVAFTTSQTAIEDGTTVPVHLSDGEIFTIPSFRLENDFGPSGLGVMERLQIVGVGMPGLPDEVLFDTDKLAAAREEEEFDDDSEDEDFEELMAEDGLPPLKMKASCENLSLPSINDKSRSQKEGSIVTFQIAATHDMGNQLADGGNVRIRFRYRGISPNPATEIWRKREISLRIVRVKGPRISSLTFRSDLGWGSAYSELCMSLAQQKEQFESLSGTPESFRFGESSTEGAQEVGGVGNTEPLTVLTRVGLDQGVHVSSDEVVVLMAVANETNSTIVLSNRKGRVGGFEGSPMPTVRVTSGVSVKIPVVIPRIPRLSQEEEDGVTDIAAALVTNTALHWESVVDSKGGDSSVARTASTDSENRKIRQGRVRIPSKCLREIMAEHPSFASRICEAPVSVAVSIGRSPKNKYLEVTKGTPVDTFVEIKIADWVPAEVVEACSVVLEFCCARKNSKVVGTKKEFMWFGRLRRSLPLNAPEKKHRARIAFLSDGLFVVSACAKISKQEGVSETWWAPIAEKIKVETSSVSQ